MTSFLFCLDIFLLVFWIDGWETTIHVPLYIFCLCVNTTNKIIYMQQDTNRFYSWKREKKTTNFCRVFLFVSFSSLLSFFVVIYNSLACGECVTRIFFCFLYNIKTVMSLSLSCCPVYTFLSLFLWVSLCSPLPRFRNYPSEWFEPTIFFVKLNQNP